MLSLGIETSGRQGAIALWDTGGPLDERTLDSYGQRHAQALAGEIDRMLKRHSIRPSDCQLIAVSQGPGSFTGLRVGVVFAKTLAYATGSQLAAVDTFQAIAHNAAGHLGKVQVIADAQRGDIYLGHYEYRGDRWRAVAPITIRNASQWAQTLKADDVISGPGVERFEAILQQTPARCLPVEQRLPRAAAITELGTVLAKEGRLADCWSLEPFYLRKSAAEEKLEATLQRL